VDPRARFGRCGEDKNLASAGNRNLAIQPVAIPSELSRLLHHIEVCFYSEGAWLDSRPGYRLSSQWLFVVFFRPSGQMQGTVPRLGHDHFFPNHFRFSIPSMTRLFAAYSSDTESAVKQTTIEATISVCRPVYFLQSEPRSTYRLSTLLKGLHPLRIIMYW
jgi:hypothetical protein